ncbi:MAG: hypothetical protein QXR26_03250 [Candidatus Caldarchaeum sp.]
MNYEASATPRKVSKCARRRLKRADTSIGVIILASLTVALGFFIWGFALGWFGTSLGDLTNSLNRAVLQVKTTAQLSFELLNYTSAGRSAILRNIASVPVTLTRLEIVTPDGRVMAYYPATGYSNLTKVLPGANATLDETVIPLCNLCRGGDKLRFRVWFVASGLFNEANPLLSVDEMKYAETIFVYPGNPPPSACAIPEGTKWLMVDIMDPITYTDSGKIPPSPNDKLFIRMPFASHSEEVLINIAVLNATGEVGGASATVPSISNTIHELRGTLANFQVPLNITVSASGFEVVQREWFLGGVPFRAHASGVQLWWSVDTATNTRIVDVVQVELGVNDLTGGKFTITLSLYDCNGVMLYTKSNTVAIPAGIFNDSVFFDVSPPVRMDDVFKVVVRVSEA